MQDGEKNTFQFLQYNFAASLSWFEFFEGKKSVLSEYRHWITSECEKEICFVQVIAEKCKIYSNSEII